MTGEKPQRPAWLVRGAEVLVWVTTGPAASRMELHPGRVDKVRTSRFTVTTRPSFGPSRSWDFPVTPAADGGYDVLDRGRFGAPWRCGPPDSQAVREAREISAMLRALVNASNAVETALIGFKNIGVTITSLRAMFEVAADEIHSVLTLPTDVAEETHDG